LGFKLTNEGILNNMQAKLGKIQVKLRFLINWDMFNLVFR